MFYVPTLSCEKLHKKILNKHMHTLKHTPTQTKQNRRATLGQGIRSGGSVVPITGPGGLQTQTTDRRANGSLRVSIPFLIF